LIGIASFVPYALHILYLGVYQAQDPKGMLPKEGVDPELREAVGQTKKDDNIASDSAPIIPEEGMAEESMFIPRGTDASKLRSKICPTPAIEAKRFDRLVTAADLIGHSRRISSAKLAIACMVLLVVGLALKFQPWDRDNTKLYLLWLLLSAGFTGIAVVRPIEAVVA